MAFRGGERTIVKRAAMPIRIAADNRLVGYAPGPGDAGVQPAMEQVIGPFPTGRALRDPDARAHPALRRRGHVQAA